jgi:hypothetical protein
MIKPCEITVKVTRPTIFRWMDNHSKPGNVTIVGNTLTYIFYKCSKYTPKIKSADILLVFDNQKKSIYRKKNKLKIGLICNSIDYGIDKATITSTIFKYDKDVSYTLPPNISHLSHSSYGYTSKTTKKDTLCVQKFFKK